MNYRFVSLKNGERDIHWLKLGAFAALTFTAVPAVVELVFFRMTGRWSGEAALAAMFLATLIVIRSVLRAYSIPERELEAEGPTDVLLSPHFPEVPAVSESSPESETVASAS